ncbi:pyrroline-5-carboxylate reductase [Listeria weihenstephanensis FSL R9-0317]|uniref:Pyrroline-5-carboxylate reductase n=1 Tax=Listeria weihenstephanensis TaxID=1006155 RepID=A0A1S7FUC8_9LIST|nr:pyrroline-5-carboxylate reductase ProG [Listeria weihenstephanensis]AQY51066.1 pyrroline-5-carboxylate reductase [Listeria weihenstephanensis]EUJ36484.1 pyrroline-5-carboxylate reductase [Listeria weihenstephanensis FSL R9-0317]
MKVGFIGYGSMADLLTRQLLAHANVSPEDIIIYTRSENERLQEIHDLFPNITISKTSQAVFEQAQHTFVCVLPLAVLPVLLENKPALTKDSHVISIAAGVSVDDLKHVTTAAQYSKLIPSLTTSVGVGTSLVNHDVAVSKENQAWLDEALGTFSSVMEVAEENIDLASDLTSSSPGFIAAIFEQFVQAAVRKSDLTEAQVFQMISNSLAGTSKLLSEQGYTFDSLIKRVATKGGITAEGVDLSQDKLPAFFDELLVRTADKYADHHAEINEQIKELF